jgi:hypothetical protein
MLKPGDAPVNRAEFIEGFLEKVADFLLRIMRGNQKIDGKRSILKRSVSLIADATSALPLRRPGGRPVTVESECPR